MSNVDHTCDNFVIIEEGNIKYLFYCKKLKNGDIKYGLTNGIEVWTDTDLVLECTSPSNEEIKSLLFHFAHRTIQLDKKMIENESNGLHPLTPSMSRFKAPVGPVRAKNRMGMSAVNPNSKRIKSKAVGVQFE
ncbi:hypothetical protein CHUAL_004422 [Chamberlinius hualienensis]